MAAVQFTVLVLLSMAAAACAIDCLECIHIGHKSYHGLIRSSLDRFNFTRCGMSTVSRSTLGVHLRKCDSPGDRMQYRCGIIRGTATVRVDGQQRNDPAIAIDIAIRKCIEVSEDADEEFCEEDDGIQRQYLTQALVRNRENIPIQPNNVRSYEGETCFCGNDQCVSAAITLRMAATSIIGLCLILGFLCTR